MVNSHWLLAKWFWKWDSLWSESHAADHGRLCENYSDNIAVISPAIILMVARSSQLANHQHIVLRIVLHQTRCDKIIVSHLPVNAFTPMGREMARENTRIAALSARWLLMIFYQIDELHGRLWRSSETIRLSWPGVKSHTRIVPNRGIRSELFYFQIHKLFSTFATPLYSEVYTTYCVLHSM